MAELVGADVTKQYKPRLDGLATRERVYRFIVKFMGQHCGMAPTLREIMRAVGLYSTNTVRFHLMKLEGDGRLAFFDGTDKARGFYLVGARWVAPVVSTGSTDNEDCSANAC